MNNTLPMMKISKRFKRISHAERYQDKLYKYYFRVILISFPLRGESGLYVWAVSQSPHNLN